MWVRKVAGLESSKTRTAGKQEKKECWRLSTADSATPFSVSVPFVRRLSLAFALVRVDRKSARLQPPLLAAARTDVYWSVNQNNYV